MSSLRPKIGIVSVDYRSPFGGMGRHIRTLEDGLTRQRFEVAVFDASRRPFRVKILRNIGFSFFLASALRHWIREHSIDILHVHTGPGGVFLSNRFSIPTVVTVHHTFLDQCRLYGQWWKRILVRSERATLAAASAIISVSTDTTETLVSQYGILPERITTIPLGFPITPWIHADSLPENRDRMRIVFVGRRGVRKGFDLLLGAWEKIHEEFPQARLAVLGIEGVAERGITYHGWMSDENLRSLIGSSRLVVCPSRLEGFGLVAAEAIASGTPVLATNVLGLRGVVRDSVSGLLVSPDVSGILDGIRKFLQDDALWNRCHQGAQAERHGLDSENMITSHIELYHRLYSPVS